MFNDLKQRLQAMSWDKDQDGKIDVHDLMLGFDEDNDGVLDGNEIQNLATQLSSQVT